MNENGFNSSLYYQSINIYARIYSEDITKTGIAFVPSPYFLSQKMYGAIDKTIYRFYYGDSAAILSALLTGNRHHFSAELEHAVERTAFGRLLHPAYIHIWIILAVIGLLKRRVHKKYRDGAIIIILLLYAVLSCAQIGFTRCLVTAALTVLYRNKDGNVYFPDIIAKIVIFCMITMPMIIFNVTFVMSVVGGLLVSLFSPYIASRLIYLPRGIRHMTAIVITAAFIITPLASVYFNGVCIYTFAAIFVTMPVVLAMLCMTPLVFALLMCFGVAPIVGGLYDASIWLLQNMPYFIDGLPMSQMIVPTPSPSEFGLMVSVLFMLYYYIHHVTQKLHMAMGISLGLIASIAVTAVLHIGTTEFVFVNVGQGDGSVIHSPLGETVIIDGGGGAEYSQYNIGESIFVPYLASKGYYNIDAAFVSHFHKDHIEGIIAAIENLNVKTVFYLPPDPSDTSPYSWYMLMKEAAQRRQTELYPITESTRISFGDDLAFDVYVPDKLLLHDNEENDSLLFIKAMCGGSSVLYTGDMTAAAEREFMRVGTDIDADILKVAHHGSKTSTTPEWVAAVSPEHSVISCGENNPFGHPSDEALDALSETNILRTDELGNITAVIDRSGLKEIYGYKR